jgi:hypothetical protein
LISQRDIQGMCLVFHQTRYAVIFKREVWSSFWRNQNSIKCYWRHGLH